MRRGLQEAWLTWGLSVHEEGPRNVAGVGVPGMSWAILPELLVTGTIF